MDSLKGFKITVAGFHGRAEKCPSKISWLLVYGRINRNCGRNTIATLSDKELPAVGDGVQSPSPRAVSAVVRVPLLTGQQHWALLSRSLSAGFICRFHQESQSCSRGDTRDYVFWF